MSTTTTTTPIVITTADSKVTEKIASFLVATDKVLSGFNAIAIETGKVVERMGLTERQQVTDVLRYSYFAAAKLDGEDVSDNERADYLDTIKSDISNLTSLIMPLPITEGKGKDKVVKVSTKDLIAARDKAWAYNAALPKGSQRNKYIGQKTVLAIVRGLEDVDYVIGVKNGTITPTAKPEDKPTPASAAITGNAATSPQPDKDSNPEQQQSNPEQPQPQGDGQPVISNPRDLLRSAVRNLRSVFNTTHGLTPDVIKEIMLDEASKF